MRWVQDAGGYLAVLCGLARRLVVEAFGGWFPWLPWAAEVRGPVEFRDHTERVRFDDLTETVRFGCQTEQIAYRAEVS